MSILSRRNLIIGGAATLFAAPAIVRAGSLMPVKVIPPAESLQVTLMQSWVTRWGVSAWSSAPERNHFARNRAGWLRVAGTAAGRDDIEVKIWRDVNGTIHASPEVKMYLEQLDKAQA